MFKVPSVTCVSADIDEQCIYYYYMTVVLLQRPLGDSWSRGRQYVLILHRVKYHNIMTYVGRHLASMVTKSVFK